MIEKFFDFDIELERSNDEESQLILLHGLQSSSRVWDGVCRNFKKINPIKINFPGRGKSSKWNEGLGPIEYFYSLENFSRILNEIIIHRKNKNKVALAGWSMGSMVILEYIKKYGTKDISGLVLCSGITRTKGVARIFKSRDDVGLLREISDRSEKSELIDMADPIAVLNCWKSIVNFDCRNVLSKIESSTLIIHGTEDNECPHSESIIMNKEISGSKLLLIQNSGHSILFERPELIASEIELHLERLPH